MDFVRFFTREELVAGLEINSNYLRIITLPIDRDKQKSSAAFFAEESLREGTLQNGKIANREELVATIKRLIGKSKTRIRYVIVSIPDSKVFSKVFKFPKTIKNERLKGTMELSIGFQLPVKTDDVYLDWETIKRDETSDSEVLLAAVPKTIVNEYVAAIESAGLKTVAVEFNLLSIARILPQTDETIIVISDTSEGITTGFFKNNLLLFAHTISYEVTPKDKVPVELKRLVNFLIALTKDIASSTPITRPPRQSTFMSSCSTP